VVLLPLVVAAFAHSATAQEPYYRDKQIQSMVEALHRTPPPVIERVRRIVEHTAQ
jgi:hypothetical protein